MKFNTQIIVIFYTLHSSPIIITDCILLWTEVECVNAFCKGRTLFCNKFQWLARWGTLFFMTPISQASLSSLIAHFGHTATRLSLIASVELLLRKATPFLRNTLSQSLNLHYTHFGPRSSTLGQWNSSKPLCAIIGTDFRRRLSNR